MNIKTVYFLQEEKTSSFAAAEFLRYYQQITQKPAVLVDCSDDAELIAVDNATDIALPVPVQEAAGKILHDGFLSGAFEGKAYLVATCPRGLLNATYDLLKCSGGIIYAAPGKEYVPSAKEFSVEHDITVVNPKLQHRGIGFHNGWDSVREGFIEVIDWMAKMGFNWIQFFPKSYEDRREILSQEIVLRDMLLDVGAHSAFFFLSPKELYETEPELFSHTASGEKIAKQLCYGNPKTRQRLAESCVEFIARRPEIKMLGLWPQDGGGDCDCEFCIGQDRQKVMGDVVNYVAKKIELSYPGVMVNHLAYCQFIKAHPEVKFADNVLVNHCDYWARTINRPIYDMRYGQSPLLSENQKQELNDLDRFVRDHSDIRDEIVEWKKSAKTVTAFSYYSDLVMKQSLLTDVSETIESDLDFYTAIGMKGFVDCCCYPESSLAFAFNWFALGSLAWEKDVSIDTLRRDFATGYFGLDKADKVVEVYQLLNELMNKPSLLGYNVLDLYHRDPQEVARQCGVVDDLIEPEKERVEKLLNKVKGIVVESDLGELQRYVDDIVMRFPVIFELYLTWANIFRADKKQAALTLVDANVAVAAYGEWSTKSCANREFYFNKFERYTTQLQNEIESV